MQRTAPLCRRWRNCVPVKVEEDHSAGEVSGPQETRGFCLAVQFFLLQKIRV